MQWFPRKLEHQLLWLTGFCLTVSLLLDGGYAAFRQTREAAVISRSQMEALAQNIATFSAHFLATRDLDGLETIANQTATTGGIESLVVTDVAGKPLLELVNRETGWSPRFDSGALQVPVLGDAGSLPPSKPGLASVWRPVVAGVHMGWVRVRYTPDQFREAAIAAWSEALILMLTALALTLGLLKLLLRKPMRSLKTATAFADDLHHSLGRQMVVDARTRELEALGNALNRVSERLLAQNQSLTSATVEAQAASTAKSQFLANMSHEIRTPMNAILGMLTLLGKTNLNPQQADYAAKSDGAARALLGLLNEILDFSKIEAGKMTLDPQPFALDRLLRDLSVILTAGIGEKPVQLRFEIDPEVPPYLLGDAMRLHQVLINLGGNAVKFTAAGEVVLSIKLLQRTGHAVTLQWNIQDSGIGIAPENQARIFSGFTQAEASTTRNFGGTGLGVVISQRLVGLMGGELELQSAPGKGSRFFFTLTLPYLESIDTSSTEGEGSNTPASGLSGIRLLLVEDNAINQQVAQELLQHEGAQTTIANNGQEAVSLLAATPAAFDVVLMDLQMPVMDGFAATRAIRGELGLNVLPIVAMTANAMASDRQACLEAGMNDHVGKPFDLRNLVQTLRRWAGRTDTTVHTDAPAFVPNDAMLKAAGSAGVDLALALQRLGGKADIYTRMLSTFVQDLQQMPDQLNTYAKHGKTQESRRLLHTLKGLAATLGAQDFSAQAARAEKAVSGAADQPADLSSVTRRISATIAQALAPLQALLAVLEADAPPAAANKQPSDADTAALQQSLQNLAQLLAADDMQAMYALAEISQTHGDLLGSALEPLQTAMTDMDFETALTQCQALSQRYARQASLQQ